MCRYAFKTYKSHFACFNCRKTFKQAHYSDLLRRIGKSQYYKKLLGKPIHKLTEKEKLVLANLGENFKDRSVKCPECGNYMADLGLDFKSPRKQAVKEWKIIEGLYTIGKSFYSCGCNGIGYIPQNPRDYKAYLKNLLQEYEGDISYCQNQTLDEYKDKAERINHWSEQAQEIKQELEKQKFAV
jgi:uncharacterized C2H2 Zn-finger protein